MKSRQLVKKSLIILIILSFFIPSTFARGNAEFNNFKDLKIEERIKESRLDFRDFDYLTEVRDQGELGACWAFASIGSLENSLLIENEELDLSEDHLVHNAGDTDTTYESGGNNILAENYFTTWVGPVLEEDDPYGDNKTNKKLKPNYQIKSYIYPKKDIKSIKEAIATYGPVSASIYIGDMVTNEEGEHDTFDLYFDSQYNSFYYDGEDETNHDVVIVGWDDNFSKDKFKVTPLKDGAWIVRNSYSADWGENGYFYVSYYDSQFPTDPGVVTKVQKTDKDNFIYYHDANGYQSSLGYEDDDEDFMAVIFDKKETLEKLTDIGITSIVDNVDYKFYLVSDYKAVEESFDNRELIAEGTFENKGYHSIELEKPLEIGKRFAIIAAIYTEDYEQRIPVAPYNNENLPNEVYEDQGYISADGVSWESTYYEGDDENNFDLCIRAYTKK